MAFQLFSNDLGVDLGTSNVLIYVDGKGVVIENNTFETFDAPIVYAKSLDGLVFRGNKIIQNNDFEPFHWNRYRFLFDRVVNVTIENNEFVSGFNPDDDVKYRY